MLNPVLHRVIIWPYPIKNGDNFLALPVFM